MAFISTEKVKEIRTQLKKEFPNLKFSVKNLHYSKVKIVIKSGNINFIADYKSTAQREYLNISEYSIDQFIDISSDVLKKVFKIAKSQGWYDNSDAMTDYFDTAYYIDIQIGDWEEPYIFKDIPGKVA